MLKNIHNSFLVSIGMAILTGVAPTAMGQEIEDHQAAGVVDLVPGAARGTIRQPLVSGMIASTGAEVLFVVTDASDADFAPKSMNGNPLRSSSERMSHARAASSLVGVSGMRSNLASLANRIPDDSSKPGS